MPRKSPIDNFDEEQARIEQLIGITDDVLAMQTHATCCDCLGFFEKDAMWWTPEGNRCRTCYEAKYGVTTKRSSR